MSQDKEGEIYLEEEYRKKKEIEEENDENTQSKEEENDENLEEDHEENKDNPEDKNENLTENYEDEQEDNERQNNLTSENNLPRRSTRNKTQTIFYQSGETMTQIDNETNCDYFHEHD